MVLVIYVMVAPGGELLSGVDVEELNTSATSVTKGIVLPVGLGVLCLLAAGVRWRWPDLLTERPELRLSGARRLWVVPGMLATVVGLALATAPWSEWSAAPLVLLLMGMLLVGAGEELVFRGYLLVGARTRFSERGACVLTCGLFGLIHAVNLIAGQAPGDTVAQILLGALLGLAFYLLRRMSGALVLPILTHAVWNFSFYLHASAP